MTISRTFVLLFFSTFFSQGSFALVDMRNGNFVDTAIDMRVPGSGYDLQVQRVYNSRTLFNGIFGFGHCLEFETKIEITPENTIRLTECGGGQEVIYSHKDFDKNMIAGTIKTIMNEVRTRNKTASREFLDKLETDLRTNEVLRREFTRELQLSGKVKAGVQYLADGRKNENITMTGSTYKRMLADGTYEVFDAKGRMTAKHDRNGNFLKINYDKDLIISVVDNNGRQLNFSYNPKNRKITEIKGPSGLVAKYTIDGQNLTAVTNAWNNTYKFTYDELHNMTKISFPDKTSKALTYDKERDWVMSFKDRRDCQEKYEYGMNPKEPDNHFWSDVTKTCGKKVTNKSRYEFWNKDKPDGSGKYLARVKSTVNGDISDITYHETFGKPTSVLKDGRRTIYAYHDNGLVKTKIEEMKATAFAYNQKCMKPALVTVQVFENTPANLGKAPASRKVEKTSKTQYTYEDGKCNMLMARNSDGQTAKVKYDNQGRIAVIEDQAKKVVSVKYEGRFGKPSVVSIKGLGTINVTYKANGEIDKVNSDDGTRVAVQVASIFNNLLDLIAPATSEATI